MSDARKHAPSAQRNRDPILGILRGILPPSGTVLEVASGTGEHIVHFAKALPDLTFRPSDANPANLESIAAWIGATGIPNVLPPIRLDVTAENWPVAADALVCINMIHIAPWAAAEGLMRGAARLLRGGQPLFLYGPYKRGGMHTAESNEAFDADLRARDAAWGVRDLEAVEELAEANGFDAPRIFDMPANNLSLVFTRR